ncbi:hypothetical protein BN871_HX_00010, partial [Paenibacillus sp. P22]
AAADREKNAAVIHLSRGIQRGLALWRSPYGPIFYKYLKPELRRSGFSDGLRRSDIVG